MAGVALGAWTALPAQAAEGLESAADRAALPEFQTIPAALPAELTPAAPGHPEDFTTWTRSQGDAGSRRYSALTQINRANVAHLAVAWTYHSRDGRRNIQCTPIVVDGVMYAPTAGRDLVALDAASGTELWRFRMEQPAHPGLEDEPARRGLVYWAGDRRSAPRILFGNGNWLFALDPQSGAPLEEFGGGGRTPLPTGATVGGAVYRGIFVTAGLYGDIYGYNARNGRLVWRFHTVPRGREPGADTWSGPDTGFANCWGGLSIDEDRGIVLAAIGAPQTNFIGAGRLGDDLYGDCVVALDALTGRRLWYFQNLRHDIWDLDNPAAPNLVTITRDGRRIDAVTCLSKAGMLLLLDRTSGKPIFPFRLRRAPVSVLPGERTAPYQPDPERPEMFSRMDFRPEDVTTRTPQAHDFVLRQVERSTYGWFQPFTEDKPNLFIGSRGGGEWSGAAVDVPSGRLYVTSNHIPSKVTVFAADEGPRDPAYPPSAGERVYLQSCAACHGPGRAGQGMVPPLIGLGHRMDDGAVLALLRTGRNAMPPAPTLTDTQRADLLDFLFRRNQPPQRKSGGKGGGNAAVSYAFDGYNFLSDPDGYPGSKPPWGLLNCYDLNTGRILWRVPLGEYPELVKQGLPPTGAQNLGGATVTAGGLVFCAGTADRLIRAFDADTGRELWRARLPWAGYAAPAVYEAGGREFVVITATGGGKVGGPTGDAYVAFALPSSSK
jgi:quinoprotein glucose dehydrogenase